MYEERIQLLKKILRVIVDEKLEELDPLDEPYPQDLLALDQSITAIYHICEDNTRGK